MKVLLAIDESESSAAAAQAVAARAWPSETTVRVLSVVDENDTSDRELYGSLAEKRRELIASADKLTVSVAESLTAGDFSIEALVRSGDPSAEIVKEAEEWPADLIVVGSHGYTGLKRLLLGSVAQSVVNHAPCSVEVVRLKRATAGG